MSRVSENVTERKDAFGSSRVCLMNYFGRTDKKTLAAVRFGVQLAVTTEATSLRIARFRQPNAPHRLRYYNALSSTRTTLRMRPSVRLAVMNINGRVVAAVRQLVILGRTSPVIYYYVFGLRRRRSEGRRGRSATSPAVELAAPARG
jgi:hypothetical protein